MDPATIAAIVKAAYDFYQSQQDKRWKQDVSDKLDQILSKLDQIDGFLHQIPGIFVTALDDEQRKKWQTEIETAVQDINDLIASDPHGPKAGSAQRRWEDQMSKTKTLAEENMDFARWGFEQFAVVAVALSACAGLANFAPNRPLLLHLVQNAKVYYSKAIDAEVPGSFGAALKSATAARAALVNTIDPYFNAFWSTGLGDSLTPPHGPSHSVTFTYKVDGSVEAGVGETHPGRTPGNPPYMPGTSGPNAENQGLNILNSGVVQYRTFSQQIASAQQCVDACETVLADLGKIG